MAGAAVVVVVVLFDHRVLSARHLVRVVFVEGTNIGRAGSTARGGQAGQLALSNDCMLI